MFHDSVIMHSKRPSSFIAQVLLLILSLFVWKSSSRDVNGSRLVQLNDCTCLGHAQIFECTAFGAGFTIWNSTFFDCQNGRNEIPLRHSQYGDVESPPRGECNRGAVIANGIGNVDNQCYISQLIVTIGEEMINETIKCSHNDLKETVTIGQRTLMITETPYPPPTNIHIESNDSSQITFAWDEVTSRCSSIQYIITAINCGLCPNITAVKNVTCVWTDIMHTNHATTCMFAVQTEICGHLLGERSDYVILHFDNDEPPRFKLKFYYSTKNATVEIVLTDEGILENIDSPPISYTITYTDVSSGSICDSVSIPASSCLNGLCCHTFGEISSPCSSDGDISIFVFATSALGDGPLSQPLIFSLKTPRDEPALDCGTGDHMTAELVLPVTAASLGAALVLVTAVSIVMVIKLQKDKTNMAKLIRSMSSSGITVNRGTNQEYENIEICDQKAVVKTSDIKTNQNPAYSTVKDL